MDEVNAVKQDNRTTSWCCENHFQYTDEDSWEMDDKIVIGWKVASLDPNIASVRYRAILPSIFLESVSIQSKWFARPSVKNLEDIDVLVIVKSFTEDDVFLVEQASQHGIPVVLDLCDNIFVPGYLGRGGVPPADNFRVMAKQAAAITTTTETLAEQIMRNIGEQPQVFVIPDGLMALGQEYSNGSFRWEMFREKGRRVLTDFRPKRMFNKLAGATPGSLLRRLIHPEARQQVKRRLIKFAYRRLDDLRQKVRYVQLRAESLLVERFVAQSVTIKRILWFGNHGAPYSRFGMLELLIIRDALERIAAEIPVELWVVSNNREKYNSDIAPMAIPTHYVEWSPDAMKMAFSGADVVVLPSTCDSFSICKSANRAILALSNKIPVVATLTPALEPLRGCVWHGDPYEGISAYLRDSGLVQEHLARGRLIIEREFSASVITRRWQEVLRMTGSI